MSGERNAKGQVVVSVTDTGHGIPADQLSRIFERFFQGDASRRAKGVGLGLAIRKELAQAHKGHIKAESVVGVGSKFSVLLPAAEVAPTVIRRRQ